MNGTPRRNALLRRKPRHPDFRAPFVHSRHAGGGSGSDRDRTDVAKFAEVAMPSGTGSCGHQYLLPDHFAPHGRACMDTAQGVAVRTTRQNLRLAEGG